VSTLPGPRARTAAPLDFPQLLGRFLLAGLMGGALAAAWLLLVTEPVIHSALVVEARRAPGQDHEAVSRATQLLGGVLGIVITGVVLALVLATVYGKVRHRLPGRTDLARTALLAATGFAIVGVLPAVVIPANPPGAGDPGTVTTRTTIYGGVLVCGILIAVLTGALVGRLRARGVRPARTAAAAAALALTLAVVVMILLRGGPDMLPADMPAGLVWRFRLASLGQLLVLFGGIGLIGGRLIDRASPRRA
jgi:Probable cobalt transporter subunit (CbtA)